MTTDKVSDENRKIIGLPNYYYMHDKEGKSFSVITKEQMNGALEAARADERRKMQNEKGEPLYTAEEMQTMKDEAYAKGKADATKDRSDAVDTGAMGFKLGWEKGQVALSERLIKELLKIKGW